MKIVEMNTHHTLSPQTPELPPHMAMPGDPESDGLFVPGALSAHSLRSRRTLRSPARYQNGMTVGHRSCDTL